MKKRDLFRFLLISFLIAISLEAPAKAGCPNDWDCALFDILVSPVSGDKSTDYKLLNNTNDTLKLNDSPAAYAQIDPNRIGDCREALEVDLEEDLDFEQYCGKRAILFFAAHNKCEKINGKARALCQGFQPYFDPRNGCEGLKGDSLNFCTCLHGGTKYDEKSSKDDKDMGAVLDGCKKVGYETLFMKGGSLSCADKIESNEKPSRDSATACGDDNLNLSKEKDEITGLDTLIRAAVHLEDKAPKAQPKPFTPAEAVDLLPHLTSYMDKRCREQYTPEKEITPLGTCLYEKMKSLLTKPIEGYYSNRVREKLFETSGNNCAALGSALNKILNDVITPNNNFLKKGANHPDAWRIDEVAAQWSSLQPVERLSVANSLNNMPDSVKSHLHGPALVAAQNLNALREDHSIENSLYFNMMQCRADNFMRETFPGLSKTTRDHWRDTLGAFARRNLKLKKSTNVERDFSTLLAKLPSLISKFSPPDQEYLRKYRTQTTKACTNKDEIRIYVENLSMTCEDWANRMLSNFLILRFITPTITPVDIEARDFKDRMQASKEFLKRANSITQSKEDSPEVKEFLRELSETIPLTGREF